MCIDCTTPLQIDLSQSCVPRAECPPPPTNNLLQAGIVCPVWLVSCSGYGGYGGYDDRGYGSSYGPERGGSRGYSAPRSGPYDRR